MKEHPRVVSLVPSWTETLFAFGLGAEVVGVTRYCVHPKELVEHVEKVGGTKNPDVARIIALAPDLVVCDHEEQRKEDVASLKAAGLRVWVSDVRSLDDSLRDIQGLAREIGRESAGIALLARIEDAMREITQTRPRDALPVYCPIWRSPWMTPTKDTYTHHVLALAGARNVFGDDAGRYPERGPEEAIEAGARAALLPTEPYPFHEKPQAIDELVEAGFPRERIRILDGEALTWYGAREPDGLRTTANVVKAIHG